MPHAPAHRAITSGPPKLERPYTVKGRSESIPLEGPERTSCEPVRKSGRTAMVSPMTETPGADKTHAPDATQAQAMPRKWLRLVPLALAGGALAFVLASGAHKQISLENIFASRAALEVFIESNRALALLAYIGLYAIVAGLSIPGATLLTLAGGFLFGGLTGALAAIFGATLGATGLFLAARSSLGATLTERAGPWLQKFRAGFQRDAISYLLFLRLVPVFPFWLVNLALATTGVRLWTFTWTTFVGIVPGAIACALAGAGLDSIAQAQKRVYEACVAAGGAHCQFSLSAQQLATRELLIALTAMGFVALIPALLRLWRAWRSKRLP